MTTTIDFDLPDDADTELAVSHIVRINGQEYRVLAEPHQWHLLDSATTPLSVFRAYLHPKDFPKFDSMLRTRGSLGDAVFGKLASAIMEKPSGHPTKGSAASSTS